MSQRNDLCSCGSGRKYKKCCLPFADQRTLALDAIAEFRSAADEGTRVARAGLRDDGLRRLFAGVIDEAALDQTLRAVVQAADYAIALLPETRPYLLDPLRLGVSLNWSDRSALRALVAETRLPASPLLAIPAFGAVEVAMPGPGGGIVLTLRALLAAEHEDGLLVVPLASNPGAEAAIGHAVFLTDGLPTDLPPGTLAWLLDEESPRFADHEEIRAAQAESFFLAALCLAAISDGALAALELGPQPLF